MPRRRLSDLLFFTGLSPGTWVVVATAILSTAVILLWQVPKREGLEMWTFYREHARMYRDVVEQRNADPKNGKPVNLFLLDGSAMTQRLMAGFLSDTPIADLLEIERNMASLAFSGPLEDVGFLDLTERLKEEGIYDRINTPSFSPWTSRGRIFGLPHDVHPVALAYRADIVEAAGIDVNQIETWEDFARVMRPLVKDFDGDGKPDRYPMNMWYSSIGHIEVLILQAGGGFFDQDMQPIIDSQINARVIATVVSWTVGPDRIAIDAPPFTASGNYLRLEGRVVCELMADWMAGAWKMDMPGLGGKLKLMPLPAWEKGGRRTGVMGGTMLGIAKSSDDIEAAWEFAKHLYLDPKLAEQLYRTNSIISPVREFWDLPFYDEPDPYFSGQPSGRIFINMAPDVPMRTSSPFNKLAFDRVQEAVIALWRYAQENKVYDAESLMPEARRLLAIAQAQTRKLMDRNVFLKADQP
jgi:arabinooligosaccharide transport system substrate-binding protein